MATNFSRLDFWQEVIDHLEMFYGSGSTLEQTSEALVQAIRELVDAGDLTAEAGQKLHEQFNRLVTLAKESGFTPTETIEAAQRIGQLKPHASLPTAELFSRTAPDPGTISKFQELADKPAPPLKPDPRKAPKVAKATKAAAGVSPILASTPSPDDLPEILEREFQDYTEKLYGQHLSPQDPRLSQAEFEKWQANRQAARGPKGFGARMADRRRQGRAYQAAAGLRESFSPEPTFPLVRKQDVPRWPPKRAWSTPSLAARGGPITAMAEKGALARLKTRAGAALAGLTPGKALGLGVGAGFGAWEIARGALDAAQVVQGIPEKREERGFQKALGRRQDQFDFRLEEERTRWELERSAQSRAQTLAEQNPSLAQVLMGLPEMTSNEAVFGAKPQPENLMEVMRLEALQQDPLPVGSTE